MDNKEITLADIVEIEHWQKIQDHFAQVIGVTIRTIDKEGKPITRLSNPTRICEEVLSSSVGMVICERCLPEPLADLCQKEKWRDGYKCHLGLYNFCIPVVAYNSEVVAYMVVGPVFLGQRREAGEYKQKAEELNIDLEKLIDCLLEIKLFSFNGIKSVIELINEIACNVAQLGYNRFVLERGIPLPKLSKLMYRFYMDKILNALLDVSSHTAKAEFGSIMLLDDATQELYIKIARGLKDDIVKNTRQKINDGIAGFAIKAKRFLLLDENLTDKDIKSRLKRPEIKSAIVAPLKIKDEPFGVINLGTYQAQDKITPENIETLHRLIELTESTLSDLKE